MLAGLFFAVVLCWSFFAWLNRVPDPIYEGKPLSKHIDLLAAGSLDINEASHIVSKIGAPAVPQLFSLAEGNRAAMTFNRLLDHLPSTLRHRLPQFPEQTTKNQMAESLLWRLDTNASAAIPYLISGMTNRRFSSHASFNWSVLTLVGSLAPGTEFELSALNAILPMAESGGFEARLACDVLGGFTNRSDLVVPVLIECLQNNSTWYESVSSLAKFGTNALHPLRTAAQSEGNVFGPLSSALELLTP